MWVVYYTQRCYKGICIVLTQCVHPEPQLLRHAWRSLSLSSACLEIPLFTCRLIVVPAALSSVPLANSSFRFPINSNLSPLERLPKWPNSVASLLTQRRLLTAWELPTHPSFTLFLFMTPGTACYMGLVCLQTRWVTSYALLLQVSPEFLTHTVGAWPRPDGWTWRVISK